MNNDAHKGYAAALGDLIRSTTIDDIEAREALKSIGVSRKDLVKHGVEAYDLDEIFKDT